MTVRILSIDAPLLRLKLWPLLWAVALSLGLLIGIVYRNTTHVAASQTETTASATESNLISLTNVARHDLNLRPLHWNAELYAAAHRKAVDMLAGQYFDHTSPTGVTPWVFIHATGYAYTSAGENLAIGFTHNAAIVTAWMQSPAHRANIVDPDFTDIAIATQTGRLDGKEVTVVVQMFGQPISIIGQFDASLLGSTPTN